MPEKTVQKEPGKKPAPSKKPKPQQEVVVQIPLSELHPFPDHPFQVREDAPSQFCGFGFLQWRMMPSAAASSSLSLGATMTACINPPSAAPRPIGWLVSTPHGICRIGQDRKNHAAQALHRCDIL